MSKYREMQRGNKSSTTKDKTYGFLRPGSSVTSPRRNGQTQTAPNSRFSTLRAKNSLGATNVGGTSCPAGAISGAIPNPGCGSHPPASSMSSYTISGSCSSSSNSNHSSGSNTYGFVSGFPHLTYSGLFSNSISFSNLSDWLSKIYLNTANCQTVNILSKTKN